MLHDIGTLFSFVFIKLSYIVRLAVLIILLLDKLLSKKCNHYSMGLKLSKIDQFTESISVKIIFLKYIIITYKWYIDYIKNANSINYFFKYNYLVT